MTARGLGLVGLLVGLALLGGLWAMQARSTGPGSKQAQHLETQAQQNAAGIDFSQAAVALEAFRAEHATYVGATLSPSYGVQLVRADTSSYCIQSGTGPSLMHEIGPGGNPAPGSC